MHLAPKTTPERPNGKASLGMEVKHGETVPEELLCVQVHFHFAQTLSSGSFPKNLVQANFLHMSLEEHNE